ncbi:MULTISPECIES: nuclear transport factor 2 family protein [unclassified Streptomyces]|uniref:nuclear transport factor 2 family protein n=1 Tax=unclassified Streptomyces TaxID=2593676 RepID=UPI00093C9AE8|nr:nuclear transport factor 2 family protein [Streptomyces sp. TSRI0281]
MTSTTIFEELIDAIGARDLDRTMDCFTADVHYEEPAFGWDLHGLEEVREMYGPWFTNANLDTTLDDAFTAGDRGAFQFTMRGTILKELPGVWSTDAVGRIFTIRLAGVARLSPDGRMAELILYWDFVTLLSHIGEFHHEGLA